MVVLLPIPGRPLQARHKLDIMVHIPLRKKLNDVNYIDNTAGRRRQKQLCHINMLKKNIERDRESSVIFFSLLFFYSVYRPFQDYVSSYETGQSVGGAKTGEPREKPPDTPASRTWLVSHVARAGLEPTPDTAVR